MTKGPLKLLALTALALGAAFAVPAIATASPNPTPPHGTPSSASRTDCKVVTVHLTNRPDSGGHGPWAYDEVMRTADVCHVPAPTVSANVDGRKEQDRTWHYRATVIDDGTFNTITGTANSPGKGANLTAIVPGYMGGSYTASFTAPAGWTGWLGATWNGQTLNGVAGTAANPSTSDWVKALWKDDFAGNSINNDWKWTYWTCSKSPLDALEQWIYDYVHNGTGPNDGDITGKVCSTKPPTPTPSVVTRAPTLPTPTVNASGIAAGGGSLPVTGARTDLLVIGGVLLSLLGGLVRFVLRRRQTRFEA